MPRSDKNLSKLELVKTDTLGRAKTTPEQRDAILDAFEAGGLSGPKFARLHGINYQTFASWRQRRRRDQSESIRSPKSRGRKKRARAVTLVEAELSERPQADGGLRVNLPGGASMLLRESNDIAMGADLLRSLAANSKSNQPC